MMRSLFVAALVGLLWMPVQAVETETWSQSSFEEFAKGKRERVALRSDGLVTLSPEVKELLDSSADAIWALAADSKGNVYTVAAAPQDGKLRLFRMPAGGGKAESLAELDGLACFSLVVDSKDRVYAGVSPEAKIYRVTGGTAEVFAELPAAYVWAMAFDSKQNLYAATGDKGVIYRIDGNGKSAVHLETEETHVRALIVDTQDNLYAGTAPSGLVMRVSPAGEPFVVYQASREEISALTRNREGDLFVAAVGGKRSPGSRLPLVPVQTVVPTPTAPAAGASPPAPNAAPQAPRPAPGTAPARPAVAGGAEVVRVGNDGFPEVAWESDRGIVYALAMDGENRVLVGTGNEGELMRLDGNRLSTSLLQVQAEQVTALLALPQGALVFSTANIGKVQQAGPALAETGSIESDVFDSEFFARWGRVAVKGKTEGDALQVKVRSGNVNRPQKNWSPWSAAVGVGTEKSVVVPPARYVQWRADLKRAATAPELRSVDLAYRSKNVPPRITIAEATPPNFTFPPRMLNMSGNSEKITLPPLSSKGGPRSTVLPTTGGSTLGMNYAKGHVGVRWLAEDDNRDELRFELEIRAEGASNWLRLVKDLAEPQYSFDSNSWPDGRYEVRITASDRESNVAGEALEGHAITDAFTIDNTKPTVNGLTAKWVGGSLELSWNATDERSPIRKAHYSLNGQDWSRVEPENGLSDAASLRYLVRLPASGTAAEGASAALGAGSVLAVRVADEFDNETVASVAVTSR